MMIISSISQSKRKSLTALHLIAMAALATLTLARCLSISEEAKSGSEQLINSTKLGSDSSTNKAEAGALIPVVPLSAPIGASMDSASGNKKHKEQHYLSESLSNHQYVAMHPIAHAEPRIWKGLGLGAGILGR